MKNKLLIFLGIFIFLILPKNVYATQETSLPSVSVPSFLSPYLSYEVQSNQINCEERDFRNSCYAYQVGFDNNRFTGTTVGYYLQFESPIYFLMTKHKTDGQIIIYTFSHASRFVSCNDSSCYFRNSSTDTQNRYVNSLVFNSNYIYNNKYYVKNLMNMAFNKLALTDTENWEIYSNFDIYDISSQTTIFNSNSSENISVSDSEYETDKPDDDEGFFESLINSIGGFFTGIFDNITVFFHDFFIPDNEIFSDFIESEYEYLQEKLGFLFYPVELIRDFANRVYSLSNDTSAIFTIPNVDFMGTRLINTSSINLMDIVNQNEAFSYIYQIYRVVVSGLIVIWLTNLAYKKFNETFGGGYK